MDPEVVDPWVDTDEARREYGLKVVAEIPKGETYPAVVVAVAHHQFREMAPEQWRDLLRAEAVIFDLKGLVPRQLEPIRL
jgi:UDP-N-acetyl-D-galactosamine dehydrogenase